MILDYLCDLEVAAVVALATSVGVVLTVGALVNALDVCPVAVETADSLYVVYVVAGVTSVGVGKYAEAVDPGWATCVTVAEMGGEEGDEDGDASYPDVPVASCDVAGDAPGVEGVVGNAPAGASLIGVYSFVMCCASGDFVASVALEAGCGCQDLNPLSVTVSVEEHIC